MYVQCVPKPSLIPAVLTSIERFIEENSQTLLPAWLLLHRTKIRNVEVFKICCISYINPYRHIFALNFQNDNYIVTHFCW